ncbi:MAG: VCBS domain-containing protein [Cyanobacteria bacterium P01_H01_bin.15]
MKTMTTNSSEYVIFLRNADGTEFKVLIDGGLPVFLIDDVPADSLNDFLEAAVTALGGEITHTRGGDVSEDALEHYGGNQNPGITVVDLTAIINKSGVKGAFRASFDDVADVTAFEAFAADLLGKEFKAVQFFEWNGGTNGGANSVRAYTNDEIIQINGYGTDDSFIYQWWGSDVNGREVTGNLNEFIDAMGDVFGGTQTQDAHLSIDQHGTVPTVSLNGDEVNITKGGNTETWTFGSDGEAQVFFDFLDEFFVALSDPNIDPTAGNDSFTTNEDTLLATGNLLDNDIDPNFQPMLEVSLFDGFSVDGAAVDVNPDGTFTYDPTTSATLQALNEGEMRTDTFTYVVQDRDGGTDIGTVTLTVEGVNDIATITPNIGGLEIVEEDNIPSVSGSLTVEDVDDGQNGFQAISNEEGDYGSFTILAGGGWTYSLNNGAANVQALAEGQQVPDSFTVTSIDGTASETIDFIVVGNNDAAEIGLADLEGAVTEDDASPILSDTGTFAFTDVDQLDSHSASALLVSSTNGTALGTLSASVTTQTNGSGLGGVVTWTYEVDNAAVQFLGEDDAVVEIFTVTLDDGGINGEVTRDVEVTINGINDAPTDLSLSNDSIAEDQLIGTVIGNLSANDVDGTTRTFEIIDDPDGKFEIVDNELRLAAPLDFETATSHVVEVRVRDEDDGVTDQEFVITVEDVDDVPVIDPTTFEIQENAFVGAEVGSITDSAGVPNVKYSILPGAFDYVFTIDENTGQITVADRDALDFELNPSLSIQVQAESNGFTDVETVTVNLIDRGIFTFDASNLGDSITVSPVADGVVRLSGTVNGQLLDQIVTDAEQIIVNGLNSGDFIQANGDFTRSFLDDVGFVFNGDFGSDILVINLSGTFLPGAELNGGGGGSDRLVDRSNDGDTVLNGSELNDRFQLFGGSDTVNAGGGNDIIQFFVLDGGDTVDGGSGYDEVRSINLTSNAAVNDIFDGSGFISVERIILSGGRGDDTFTGSSGNDDLRGDGDNDILRGGAGSDILVGGRGIDRLEGGTENDTLRLEDVSTGDFVDGGAGFDRLQAFAFTDTTGLSLDGSSITNTAIGGTVILNGDAANPLAVNVEVLDLRGGSGNDILIGGASNDILFGITGNDILQGNAGNDDLFGGGNDDIFIFKDGDGVDRVFDFNSGNNRIDLSGISGITGSTTLATLASDTGGSLFQSGTTTFLSFNGGSDQFQIFNTPLSSLTDSDFIFV